MGRTHCERAGCTGTLWLAGGYGPWDGQLDMVRAVHRQRAGMRPWLSKGLWREAGWKRKWLAVAVVGAGRFASIRCGSSI